MEENNSLYLSFSQALQIDINLVNDDLAYQSIPEWDSITHMLLISQLEEDFDVSIDTDDVIDLSTVKKAKGILLKLGAQL